MKTLVQNLAGLSVMMLLSMLISGTAQAVELPFIDNFEGSMAMTVDNHPTTPATVKLEACPSGRIGQCLAVSNLSKNGDYRPALVQSGLNIQNGQTYTISMQVRSDRANQFKFYIKEYTSAYFNPISGTRICYTDINWTSCSITFTANTVNTINVFGLYLELAQVDGILWLDDVSITPGSPGTGTQCPANAASCGFYTQQEVTDAANAAAASAKQACKANPASCDITVTSGYTQQQLNDAANAAAAAAKQACQANPTSGTSTSISADLDITISRAMYTMPGGLLGSGQTVPIWANLRYVPQNGQHFWTLSGAGMLQ